MHVQNEIPLALLMFNVGIELWQLLSVVVILVLIKSELMQRLLIRE